MLVVTLAGCYTFRNAFVYRASSKPGEQADIKNKQAVDFLAGVRPVMRGNPESHYLLGCYYQDRGYHQEAIAEFNKVLAIDPGHAEAYNRLGVCYDQIKKYQQAAASYHAAITLNPSLAHVYNNIGYSSVLQNKPNEAIDSYSRALQLNPDSKRIHNNLGVAYALDGQFAPALREFETGGDPALARYNLAQLCYQRGQYAEAREYYLEALSLNPFLELARTALEQCDRQIASIGEQAIANNASSPTIPASPAQSDRETIEIRNGNGKTGMARSLGSFLENKGYTVVRIANADHFCYPAAMIFYRKEYRDFAIELAHQIPGAQRIQVMRPSESSSAPLKVLVGKDLLPYQQRILTEKKG